jgi:hypothetical protein
MDIRKEFQDITDFALPQRVANLLSDKEARKDLLFLKLANLFFLDRARMDKLLRRIGPWLKVEESQTTLALAGYIYYIFEEIYKYSGKSTELNYGNEGSPVFRIIDTNQMIRCTK